MLRHCVVMMGLSTMQNLVESFHPYRVIACYAIFFVFRAEGNVKNSLGRTELEGPIHELLRNTMATGEEELLLTEFSRDGRSREAVVLNHANGNDVSLISSQRKVELPLPAVIKGPDHSTANYELGSETQTFCTSTGVLDKLETSSRIEDKPFQNVFTYLPVLAPTSNRIRNESCRKQSRIFVQQLKRYKLWALQMYDSSAKLPSGVLRGNVNQMGDFDQCLAVVAEDPYSFNGKYCLASVDVQWTVPNSNDTATLEQAVHLAQAYGFIKSSYRDPGHFIPQFTTVRWATCVPAACSPADVEQTFADALQDYNGTIGLSFDVHVDPDMCYVKHETNRPLGPATVFTLAFFGIVICVAAVATFRDTRQREQHLREKGRMERLVMAFSVRKNVDELLADVPADGDITCIYGVRAVCTIALYLAHKVITLAFSPYSNRVVLTEVSNETWSTVFRASLVYTDSFLLLSGVLTSFNMSKEIQRKKHIDWIKKYVARFIRLTPALLAVGLFHTFVLEHLGTGPLWNQIVKRNADFCKESLWKNILYIQNFYPFEKMCATHTHQLALDMQLSLLSPLLVTLLWQWRVCGVLVLLCLHALSASLRYLAALRNHLSLFIFHGETVTELYQSANLSYSQTLHRATPYLLGVSLGYLLHKTGKRVYIPKMAVWAGWLLAIYFAYLSVLSQSNLGLRDYKYNVHEASIYAAFSPIFSSLALAWLIGACFTGNGGFVNKFLCSKGLMMFSRISYAVYLTQFAVFFYNVGSIRYSEEFSILRSVDLAELLTVLMVSVVLTLLFDLPMQEVKAILMGADSRRVKVA